MVTAKAFYTQTSSAVLISVPASDLPLWGRFQDGTVEKRDVGQALHAIHQERRKAAAKVRLILEELEAAEREFAVTTEKYEKLRSRIREHKESA